MNSVDGQFAGFSAKVPQGELILRKRWHVLTLLTVAVPVLASAEMVGIAETREGSYTVVRGEYETLVARAQTPVLLNSTDRVATRESEVRIRMVNGSAVVLRKGEISFPSADLVRVHSGEAAVSFPSGSQTIVESGDYRFSPAADADGASSLVVANDADSAVAARSLRGHFSVSDLEGTSPVASLYSPEPASAMMVSTTSYGFIPSALSQSGAARPDLFFQPASAAPEAPTAFAATVASVPTERTAPVAPSPVQPSGPNPVAPVEEIGAAGLLPTPVGGGGVIRTISPYDLTQPVSSFVTEPGDRPPRPRR